MITQFLGWGFLAACSCLVVASRAEAAQPDAPPAGTYEAQARGFLKTLLLTPQQVDDWLALRKYRFGQYEPTLGYIHCARVMPGEGLDGSAAVYTYDEHMARRMFDWAHKPCRINTYGNSFTSCEQVNDGESWQEVLAGHLCEPVRNYGVGGYSVYQSYLRMVKMEEITPADVIIFNIFEDDHFRNLISWQRIRFGVSDKSFHPPVPYVKVNPATGLFQECANPCTTSDSLRRLRDPQWVFATFGDDFVLKITLAQQAANRLAVQGGELKDRHLAPALMGDAAAGASGDAAAPTDPVYAEIERLAAEFGMPQAIHTREDLARVSNQVYLKASLFASERIVDLVEAYAAAHGKRVLYVLSYGSGAKGVGGGSMAQWLRDGTRFDQEFVDYLKAKGRPVVDMMEAHKTDYAAYKIGVDEYLQRYYVGHYSPLGNFFCAFAIKTPLVAMLDPKPLPYRAME